MTKQEIYEQIVQLTSELHATNVAEKIFSAAKEGDPEKVEEVFETFKKEYPDLYQKIIKFEEDYDGEYLVIGDVFGSEEDEVNGAYIYDNNIINAVTLYALILLGEMDEFYLFDWGTESSRNFVNAIKEAGYKELANFVEDFSICDLGSEGNKKYRNKYDCLVGIFEGEFEI